jgi:hypothetical protein
MKGVPFTSAMGTTRAPVSINSTIPGGNGTVRWSWGTIQQSLRATGGGGTRIWNGRRWHGDGYTAGGHSEGPADPRRNRGAAGDEVGRGDHIHPEGAHAEETGTLMTAFCLV